VLTEMVGLKAWPREGGGRAALAAAVTVGGGGAALAAAITYFGASAPEFPGWRQ
jgi:hypothetical protein